MPISTRYVFIASMDVNPEKEDLFNEVYDTEHVPYLLDGTGSQTGDGIMTPVSISVTVSWRCSPGSRASTMPGPPLRLLPLNQPRLCAKPGSTTGLGVAKSKSVDCRWLR